jgi:hypothetical protein
LVVQNAFKVIAYAVTFFFSWTWYNMNEYITRG